MIVSRRMRGGQRRGSEGVPETKRSGGKPPVRGMRITIPLEKVLGIQRTQRERHSRIT